MQFEEKNDRICVCVCLDRSAPANVELLVEMFVELTARDDGGTEVEAGERPGRTDIPHLGQAGVQSLVLIYNSLQISTITVKKKEKNPHLNMKRIAEKMFEFDPIAISSTRRVHQSRHQP